jgi:hypothetical protein
MHKINVRAAREGSVPSVELKDVYSKKHLRLEQ